MARRTDEDDRMKISGNEIRPGYVLEHKDRIWMVARAEHVKPGKGPAYQQVELKDMVDGTKLNERFRAVETVERVRLDEQRLPVPVPGGRAAQPDGPGELRAADASTRALLGDRAAVPAGGHDAHACRATRAGR